MALQEDPPAGVPEWVVTFGDMMSLLLTFFIMLVSMSEMKQQHQYQAMMESLRQQFGHAASKASLIPGNHRPRNSSLAALASMGRSKRLDTLQGGDKVLATVGENPRVTSLRPADYVAPKDVLTFAHASAEFTPEMRQRLTSVLDKYRGKSLKIEIRGHTSLRPLPKTSPYRDEWELAHERCRAVVKELVEAGIDPRRIVMVSAGAQEPLYLNNPELIGLNDRVELTQLNESWQARAGQPGEAPPPAVP